MALQIQFTDDRSLITLDAAYAKVAEFIGNKAKISATVFFYASKDAADQGLRPLRHKRYEFDYDMDTINNPLAYLYAQLKSVEDFASSTDV